MTAPGIGHTAFRIDLNGLVQVRHRWPVLAQAGQRPGTHAEGRRAFRLGHQGDRLIAIRHGQIVLPVLIIAREHGSRAQNTWAVLDLPTIERQGVVHRYDILDGNPATANPEPISRES